MAKALGKQSLSRADYCPVMAGLGSKMFCQWGNCKAKFCLSRDAVVNHFQLLQIRENLHES